MIINIILYRTGFITTFIELLFMEIWKKLVAPKETDAVSSLMQDSDSKLMMLKSLGQRFLLNEETFIIDSIGQLVLLMANAPFIESDEECMQIANIVQWGVKKTNILPLITEHKEKDLAYRCLLSLGLFKKALEKRTNRYGAPSPKFYRHVGINEFRRIGFIAISNHFQKWECYLSEITY